MRRKNPLIALVIFFCFLNFLIFLPLISAQVAASELPILTVFHSPTCHNCIKAKKELLPKIETIFRGRVQINYRDITDIENYKFLLSLKEKYRNQEKIVLPVFYLEGHFLTQEGQSPHPLQQFIDQALKKPIGNDQELPPVDLSARFKSFQPLVVMAAGLIDGINPCAFTVIVFFISFLALQGYKKRELFFIGFCFIFAVFLTYVLIGLGLFGFFYRLEGFWLIARGINFFIGIFSIILGVLAVYDFCKLRKNKEAADLVLQLPKAVKKQIHYVIGLYYRKDKMLKAGPGSRTSMALITSALITGFLVSLLEAVCTGQTYLPTISYILKNSPLKLEAFGYLVFYNFMFIVPLIIIFVLGLIGVTSGQFAKFLKQHLGTVKILMAILFFSLGIFLIWRV